MSIISTAISSIFTVKRSYHYYKQKYILVYSFTLGQILIQTGLSVVFLKNGFGVVAVAASHFGTGIISTIVLSVLSSVFLKEKVSIKAKTDEDRRYRRALFFEILIFSGFIILNTVVDIMNKTMDKILLGFYNADSVSTYQLAYTFPAYLISFTSIISIVFTQQMNESYYGATQNAISELNKTYLKVSKIQTIFTLLIVGGFIACGKEFVLIWLGKGREQVYYVACCLMLTYSLTCSNQLAIVGRRIQNHHIKASLLYLFISITNIVVSLLLINSVEKKNAIWACVIGTVFTYVIGHWVLLQIYDKKITKLNVGAFFKTFLKYFIIAATIDVFCIRINECLSISTNWISFVVKFLIFLTIYLFAVGFFEKELVFSFKNRMHSFFMEHKKTSNNCIEKEKEN